MGDGLFNPSTTRYMEHHPGHKVAQYIEPLFQLIRILVHQPIPLRVTNSKVQMPTNLCDLIEPENQKQDNVKPTHANECTIISSHRKHIFPNIYAHLGT